MAHATIPHFRLKSHGRFYWEPSAALRRAGFRPIRLPDDRAAAEKAARARNAQVDAWRAETGGRDVARNRPAAGTVKAMIVEYRKSRLWNDLADKTRKDYRHYLDVIAAWAGDDQVRALTKGDAQRLYERLLATGKHHSANYCMRVLQALWKFGVLFDFADVNIGDKPALTQAPRLTPVILWRDHHVQTIVAAADAMGRHSIGTAVELNVWLGQREADVLRLPRDFGIGGQTVVTQGKTGARVDLPLGIVPQLERRRAEERERQKARGVIGPTLILSEETGRPYTVDNFGRRFRDVVNAAAADDPRVAGLRFAWLRHSAVTRMAEAGCELAEISAVTGHTNKSVGRIIEHYLVRTGEMSAQAFRKLLARAEAATGEKLLDGFDTAQEAGR